VYISVSTGTGIWFAYGIYYNLLDDAFCSQSGIMPVTRSELVKSVELPIRFGIWLYCTNFPHIPCSGEDLDGSLDTNELMQLIHMDNDVDNDNEDYEEVDTGASNLLADMRFRVKSRDGDQQLENLIAKERYRYKFYEPCRHLIKKNAGSILQGCGSGSVLDPDSVTLWIRILIGNSDPDLGSRK
jgi:hypothetical protein